MFKRILVPLDGSERAERALPVAARIAQATGGSLILLRVTGIPAEYRPYLYGSYVAQTPVFIQEALDAEKTRATAYLTIAAQSEVLTGIPTETRVEQGSVATTIIEVAQEQKIGLIVMCSHGDTGLKRWVLGSVAQKIARHSPVPVLVLHQEGIIPFSAYPDPLRPLRTFTGFVALDGSELAEAALLPAAQIVSAIASPARGMLLLTQIVKLPAMHKAPAQERVLQEAKVYMGKTVERLHRELGAEHNLAITWSVTVGENIAESLIEAAECGENSEGGRRFGCCSMIAMATHGRGGMQRWALGSVTERILGATRLPLLIVRPEVQQAHESQIHQESLQETPVQEKILQETSS